jgi:hypothetical protein
MIQFSRLLARQVRAVFRKLVSRATAGQAKVSMQADAAGLRVRLHHAEIAAEFVSAGEFGSDEIVVSLQALADCEARSLDLVTLAKSAAGVQASWEVVGVPQIRSYAAEDVASLPAFPSMPNSMTACDAGILKILADAAATASVDAVRYATNNIQLKGSTGSVIATDGRQLLQTAFELPWKEDVLVPASSVFACKELSHDGPVTIGKSEKHVTLQVGPWTLHLPIQDGRFPSAENVIPKQEAATAHCHLDADDCAFLSKAISRLPGAQDDFAPVTLDLNGEVCVRAKAGDQQQTVELVLNRSQATGAARFVMDRTYLARAVELGLADLHINDAKTPVQFTDERHKFVTVPLADCQALLPSVDAVRIMSTKDATETTPPTRRIKFVNETMSETLKLVPQPTSNGSEETKVRRTRKIKSTGLAALIEEGEALRAAARDLAGRSHGLLVALKRHRKQTRLVQTSLKALKDLQAIGA